MPAFAVFIFALFSICVETSSGYDDATDGFLLLTRETTKTYFAYSTVE